MENNNFDEIWNLIPQSTPMIIKRCPRCERNKFYSSDKFRLNAHQKKLDAWLIYKCIGCDYSYNIDIIKRKPVLQINKELLCKFRDNDYELARLHAFNINALNRDIRVDWNVEVQIAEQLLNRKENNLSGIRKILIQSKYDLKFPVFFLLREKFNLSRTKLDSLYENNHLKLLSKEGNPQTLKSPVNQIYTITMSSVASV